MSTFDISLRANLIQKKNTLWTSRLGNATAPIFDANAPKKFPSVNVNILKSLLLPLGAKCWQKFIST